MLWGVPHDLWCGTEATAYGNDVCIIVSDKGRFPCVENTIKGYEAVTRAKINQNNPVGLQLGTCRGKLTPSNNAVGRWTEGRVSC